MPTSKVIFFLFSFFLSTALYADTVFLKSQSEIKGIVVEEYIDRVKLNTVDGEIVVLKKDVKDILYDMPVQNLIKLGDFHKAKGNAARAYAYYKKAFQVDGSYKLAVSRYTQMSSMFMKQPQEQLEEEMRRKKVLMDASRSQVVSLTQPKESGQEILKNNIGLELSMVKNKPLVVNVVLASPASNAGIKRGDYIIALNNKLTGYMELEDFYDEVFNITVSEINFKIERAFVFELKDLRSHEKEGVKGIGFNLGIKEGGLVADKVYDKTLAQYSGVEEQDLIVKINGQETRYMPMDEVMGIFRETKEQLVMSVHRSVSVWGGGQ